MRDYEEKSYYEIQLDNKQLILVFLAGVTVCVLIFILGVMVGKGKKETEMALAAKSEPARPKVTEPDLNPPQEPATAVDSSPDKKGKKAKDNAKPDVSEDDMDFDSSQPSASAKPAASQKPEVKPKADQETHTLPGVAAVKQTQPAESSLTQTPMLTEPPAKSSSASASETGKRYTVQVMATASKPKAQQELTTLKAKGYTAYLSEDKTAKGSVFKVRVGHFSDSDSAKKLAMRLKDELKLETWVAELE
ncbi:MAG TPA: SPOR domain-containing protein [Acidobacteriota bacterium]|nr:SPOR domain-containing protein [Acidobacteriota bacterium]